MLFRPVFFEAGWRKYNIMIPLLLLKVFPPLFHIIPEFFSISQTFFVVPSFLLVIICFFICWFPYFGGHIYEIEGENVSFSTEN